MPSSSFRISAESSAMRSLITKPSIPVRIVPAEFGQNIRLDPVEKLRRIDQQDHPVLCVQIGHAADQPHLLGRNLRRRPDRVFRNLQDFGYAVDHETRLRAANRHNENALAADRPFLRRRSRTAAADRRSAPRRRAGSSRRRRRPAPWAAGRCCSGGRAISSTAAIGSPYSWSPSRKMMNCSSAMCTPPSGFASGIVICWPCSDRTRRTRSERNRRSGESTATRRLP